MHNNKRNNKAPRNGLELTRNENFINGDLDILDILVSHAEKPQYSYKKEKQQKAFTVTL